MKNFNPFAKLRASKVLEETQKSQNKKNWVTFIVVLFVIALMTTTAAIYFYLNRNQSITQKIINHKPSIINRASTSPSPSPNLIPMPTSKLLDNGEYHIFQSFNNCGPAALSMALRFYGVNVSQEVLGQELRPYQIPGGDNDDKSVTLEEVAEKSKEYGFTPYLRPMGNDEILKQFIAQGMPIITRTWTKPDEDIGHYRVIKGYDNTRGIYIQDDSLQGKNLQYSYADFDEIWKKFNYEYLVLVPNEKLEITKQILGEDLDEKKAWEKAIENSKKQLEVSPTDKEAGFNLSVAYYKTQDYKKSVEEFEKVENNLTFRTLWYQIEPILAYYELGNYDKVMQITGQVLDRQNRAFSELYILRGKIYEKQGDSISAKNEFEKALFYNKNLKEAQELAGQI